MKKFSFQFDAVLEIRRNQRDACRRALADVLRRDDELALLHRQVESERSRQIDELRDLGGTGDMNIDASVARRTYAGQLSGDIGGIERERELVSAQIERCQKILVHVERAVKSLERLAETQRTRFVAEQERRDQRTLEDAWQATKTGKEARVDVFLHDTYIATPALNEDGRGRRQG